MEQAAREGTGRGRTLREEAAEVAAGRALEELQRVREEVARAVAERWSGPDLAELYEWQADAELEVARAEASRRRLRNPAPPERQGSPY